MGKSQGEAEAEFTKAVIRLEKEYLGRGPLDGRTFFVDDMVLIRLRGVLTQAELKLAETAEGSALVKETRQQLFETSRPFMDAMVKEILDGEVKSFHSDISTKNNARIVVLTLNINRTQRFIA